MACHTLFECDGMLHFFLQAMLGEIGMFAVPWLIITTGKHSPVVRYHTNVDGRVALCNKPVNCCLKCITNS